MPSSAVNCRGGKCEGNGGRGNPDLALLGLVAILNHNIIGLLLQVNGCERMGL